MLHSLFLSHLLFQSVLLFLFVFIKTCDVLDEEPVVGRCWHQRSGLSGGPRSTSEKREDADAPSSERGALLSSVWLHHCVVSPTEVASLSKSSEARLYPLVSPPFSSSKATMSDEIICKRCNKGYYLKTHNNGSNQALWPKHFGAFFGG